jgi:hypothetical protein
VGKRNTHSGVEIGSAARAVLEDIAAAVRAVIRPFGSLAFVVALAALWVSARLLGEDHELGFFAGRLHATIARHPEVVRQGLLMAWLVWLTVFALALTPIDPIASRWDEVLLGALAVNVLWRRGLDARRAWY